jgi:hypothetical protein
MQTCHFCGEDQRALKNHVRLTAGGGHGPSGSYPDSFDDHPAENVAKSKPEADPPGDPEADPPGDPGDKDTEAADVDDPGSNDGSPATEATATDLDRGDHDRASEPAGRTEPDTEVVEIFETAPEAANVETASNAASAEEDSEPHEDRLDANHPLQDSASPGAECPECGGPLDTDVAGQMFRLPDGGALQVEDGDGLCRNCSVVFDKEEIRPGNPEPTAAAEFEDLPCGHERINLDAYDTETWIKCDTCDHPYQLT